MKKILVIRRDNIGDLVCTTPALAVLRSHFPDAEIAVLVNSYNAQVLSRNPHVDRVFVYMKAKHAPGVWGKIRALANRLRLIVVLRIWRPDLIVLAKSGFDRYGLRTAKFIGAKRVVGFLPRDVKDRHSFPNGFVPSLEYSNVHEVEAVARLIESIGASEPAGHLEVYPDQLKVRQMCTKFPMGRTKIALHISAREPQRRWGVANFKRLIEYIQRTHKEVEILLVWSPGKADDPHHPGDDEVANQVLAATHGEALTPLPTQTISELVNVLAVCDIFVGADGGAMHLAAALKKQVLGLFENNQSKLRHWYPWKVDFRVVHSTDQSEPNVSNVSFYAVVEALESLLMSKRH